MSHRGGHTHARDKSEPWLPIKYTVDPCQITIKSSREQYTAELHLEIRKIYIESIHLSEADWPDGCTSELEQQLQNLLILG
jgi:hypothetical protein